MTTAQGSLTVTVERTLLGGIAADATTAWEKIGSFEAIAAWHPAVESCALSTGDGAALRALALVGGGEILEREEARDDTGLTYSYAIVESPLPIAGYRSTLALSAAPGGGTLVRWTGIFSASGASDDDAKEIVTGIYSAGVDGMAEKLGATVA